MFHKDCIGQDIKVKDVIAYGDSHRTAGVNIGIVFGFSPKQVRTSIGNINPSYCVVLTEQYKAHKPVEYQKLIEDNKQFIVEDSVVIPPKPKMEYKVCLRFLGNNVGARDASSFRDFLLEVQVIMDGKIVGTSAKDRSDLKNNIYEHYYYLSRHYQEVPSSSSLYGKRKEKSGKLEIGAKDYVKTKDYTLAGTLVKNLFGSVPTSTTQFPFRGGIEALSMLADGGVVIGKTERYSSTLSPIGVILQN